MTQIKICGITSKIEAIFLNKYLPDYIGFVFTKSKRQITPEQAVALSSELSPFIKRVGVFVDTEPEYAAEIAGRVTLDALQLHGSEDGDYIKKLRSRLKPGVEIWKAIRLDAEHMPDSYWLSSLAIDRLLLDTYLAGNPGGTGRSFDWSLASRIGTTLPIVLAGGLGPGNVKQAMGAVSPYAVDTSSGVEGNGIKEEEKVKAFIEAVRTH